MTMENTGVAAELKKSGIGKLSSSELAIFFEQISALSGAAITTWESLLIITENTATGKNKILFTKLFDMVSEGIFLSEAMARCECFPDYALGMVELGEQTGRMEEVSAALTEYYKNKDKLSQSIRTALTYPLCISGMVLAVIFVLLVQVMPVFEQVFAQLGLSLNPVSLFLLNLGQNLGNYALVFLGIIIALLVVIVGMRFSAVGRKTLSRLYSVMPFTRKISMAENANRFAFSMALMTASGIDALTALEFSMLIAESELIKDNIEKTINNVKQGNSLGNSIVSSGIFEPMYNGMIIAGTRSGGIDKVFMSVADRYYEETNKYTQRLLSIIEPTLVAVLCVIVGMVMLSVMLPLTGLLAGM